MTMHDSASARMRDRNNRTSRPGQRPPSPSTNLRLGARACPGARPPDRTRFCVWWDANLMHVESRAEDLALLDGDKLLVRRANEFRLRANQTIIRHLLEHVR